MKNQGTDQSLRRKQDTNTSNDRRPVSRVPHGKMWRRKLDYKDSEETKITSINEVSKDDSVVDKNDIHYDEKKNEDVKEHTNVYEDDEEEYNGGCLF